MAEVALAAQGQEFNKEVRWVAPRPAELVPVQPAAPQTPAVQGGAPRLLRGVLVHRSRELVASIAKNGKIRAHS